MSSGNGLTYIITFFPSTELVEAEEKDQPEVKAEITAQESEITLEAPREEIPEITAEISAPVEAEIEVTVGDETSADFQVS